MGIGASAIEQDTVNSAVIDAGGTLGDQTHTVVSQRGHELIEDVAYESLGSTHNPLYKDGQTISSVHHLENIKVENADSRQHSTQDSTRRDGQTIESVHHLEETHPRGHHPGLLHRKRISYNRDGPSRTLEYAQPCIKQGLRSRSRSSDELGNIPDITTPERVRTKSGEDITTPLSTSQQETFLSPLDIPMRTKNMDKGNQTSELLDLGVLQQSIDNLALRTHRLEVNCDNIDVMIGNKLVDHQVKCNSLLESRLRHEAGAVRDYLNKEIPTHLASYCEPIKKGQDGMRTFIDQIVVHLADLEERVVKTDKSLQSLLDTAREKQTSVVNEPRSSKTLEDVIKQFADSHPSRYDNCHTTGNHSNHYLNVN